MRRLAMLVTLCVFCAAGAHARSRSDPIVHGRAARPPTVVQAASSAATKAKKPPPTCEEEIVTAQDKAAKKLLKKLGRSTSGATTAKKVRTAGDAVVTYNASLADASTSFLQCVEAVTGVFPANATTIARPAGIGASVPAPVNSLGTCADTFKTGRAAAVATFSAALSAAVQKQTTPLVVIGVARALANLNGATASLSQLLTTCILQTVAVAPAAADAASPATDLTRPALEACFAALDTKIDAAHSARVSRITAIHNSGAPSERQALAESHAVIDVHRAVGTAIAAAFGCAQQAAGTTSAQRRAAAPRDVRGASGVSVANTVPDSVPIPHVKTLADALAECDAQEAADWAGAEVISGFFKVLDDKGLRIGDNRVALLIALLFVIILANYEGLLDDIDEDADDCYKEAREGFGAL